jgi:hypothetical protein
MSIRRHSEITILVLLAMPGPGALAAPPAPSTAVAQDALVQHRERFKLGMDRYKAGAVAEAVATWEPIYRDIGSAEGYRLAYNLGLAYAELGDRARAVERLQSFLGEVDARRMRGERFEALVLREEIDARTRLPGLIATLDRTLDAGMPSPSAETLEVGASPGPIAQALPPAPVLESAPALASASSGATTLPDASAHPFSPALLFVSGGLALVAGVSAIVLEANANSLHNRFVAEHDATGTIPTQDRDTFSTARTWSYVAVGGGIGCGALAAGLVTWYLLGSSRHETRVVATVGAARMGGSVGVRAAF